MEKFPTLRLITTHLGGWKLWDEVAELLAGRRIYMEISFALDYLPPDKARQIILNHPPEFVLFGTDSPWTDQKTTLELFKKLDLPPVRQQAILSDNALRLLKPTGVG